MALIECADCGRQISDQAPACPQCGRPMRVTAPTAPEQAPPTAPSSADVPKPAAAPAPTGDSISIVPALLVGLPFLGATVIILAQGAIPSILVWGIVIGLSALGTCSESARLRMTSARDAAGPAGWFFGTLGLYAIAVPWFLSKRRARVSGAVGGTALLSAIAIVSMVFASGAVESKNLGTARASLPPMQVQQSPVPAPVEPDPDDGKALAELFNTETYCESVSAGNRVLRRQCVASERKSLDRLSQRSLSVGTLRACTKISRVVGGSYQGLEACLAGAAGEEPPE